MHMYIETAHYKHVVILYAFILLKYNTGDSKIIGGVFGCIIIIAIIMTLISPAAVIILKRKGNIINYLLIKNIILYQPSSGGN